MPRLHKTRTRAKKASCYAEGVGFKGEVRVTRVCAQADDGAFARIAFHDPYAFPVVVDDGGGWGAELAVRHILIVVEDVVIVLNIKAIPDERFLRKLLPVKVRHRVRQVTEFAIHGINLPLGALHGFKDRRDLLVRVIGVPAFGDGGAYGVVEAPAGSDR